MPGGLLPLYPLGQLAAALHRKPGTMRKWEHDGLLPEAPYELRIANGTFAPRRLYTRAFITTVALTAIQCGLLFDQYESRGLDEFGRLVHANLLPTANDSTAIA